MLECPPLLVPVSLLHWLKDRRALQLDGGELDCAGMRFAHYRNSARQALATALENQGAGVRALVAQLNGQALTPSRRMPGAFAGSEHSD